MVFCNKYWDIIDFDYDNVTILILIDGFLQYLLRKNKIGMLVHVTILILIDGFLQYEFLNSFRKYNNKSQSLF